MKYFINFSLLFRNPRFACLYLGLSISFIGTMITSVALPYQVYSETHSTLMVGLISLFQLIPLLFTALIGGALADRHSRKKILISAELLLALGCLLLALNAHRLHPNLISIFIIVSCMSALTGLHTPAFQGLAQQIVSAKDFAAMSSLNMFIMSLVMIAGPALAGLIIAHSNVTTAFAIDCASYTISLLAICLITKVPPLEKPQDSSVWASLKEGLGYAKGFSKNKIHD